MANPRTHPHPPGPSGRLPSRPPRHETLPPQNPPPEIQIRNPYYSNHSNSNYIFSLPPYLKYLIPQHSRLTGAVRLLYPKHNTKRNYPPRGAAPLYITSLLQILQSTRPPPFTILQISPRGKRWTLFLSASCHNLPPTIRLPPISLGNLQKVLYNITLTYYII